jgi:hypothetical protein
VGTDGPACKYIFYSVNGLQIWMEEKEILTMSPYDNFVYALKAETTKRKYPNRLDRFLSFRIDEAIEMTDFRLHITFDPKLDRSDTN